MGTIEVDQRKVTVSKFKRFTTKPITVRAIQFTGKNGKAIAELINTLENPNLLQTVRNGGKWIRLTSWVLKKDGEITDVEPEISEVARRGDWLVVTGIMYPSVSIMTDEDFHNEFADPRTAMAEYEAIVKSNKK